MGRRKKQKEPTEHVRLRHHDQSGTAPGTLVAPEGSPLPHIKIFAYDAESLVEAELRQSAELVDYLQKWPVCWINVDGLGSVEIIRELGDILKLHPLALEDVVNVNHRPKLDEYDDHLFMVMRMMTIRDDKLQSEQVSLFLGQNYVLTFLEDPGDVFDPVRDRLRRGTGRRIRSGKSDYLAYSLMDAVIDGYFPVLEHFGDSLNQLEDNVVINPTQELIQLTHDVKRDLRTLRHALWPMRDAVDLMAIESHLVHDETLPYLRDCHDHVIQVLDMLEIYRERAAGLIDIYLSSISNKMNEIMKVLTVITTIFIPLSFVAGIYGMNFDTAVSPWNMPELEWAYGYPFALGIMVVITFILIVYFAHKGWLWQRKPKD